MTSRDDPLLPYRLRTVRVGIQATLFAVALLAAYPFLPGTSVAALGPYLTVLAAALAGAGVVAALPWERLFRAGRGLTAFYAWSVGDIVLVTVLVGVSGGSSSVLWSVYALTTVFFAASYPVVGQVGLFAFTAASYLAAVLVTGGGRPAELTARIGVLGLIAFMGQFLSLELMREMSASRRRADQLRQVAGAARAIHVLDPDHVLATVVDAAHRLGWGAAAIALLDDDGRAFRIVTARGVPARLRRGTYPATAGFGARMLAAAGAVRVPDAAADPGASDLLADGFRAVLAVPVRVQGRTVGFVAGLCDEPRTIVADEVEAFELLAALAGRALDNARSFEVERRTVERLEELDRLKRDFISNVSHELRTPLTVIQGAGETVAARWSELTDEQRDLLNSRVVANAASLHRTIATLLDFSRLEAGRLDARLSPVDVPRLAREVTDRVADVLAPRALHVDAPGSLVAAADAALIERVLENLLSNVATHTPAGATATVRVAEVDGEVEVVVADTGPGIAPHEVGRVMDRFFRGGEPNTRTTRGLGLGLALVEEILELHGAHLRVDSDVGRGTRMSFRLRAGARASAAADAPAEPVS